MCRLFGFRSVFSSQVHRSLIGAENALALQSERHPDGWGVAYYLAGAPHVVKSVKTAIQDNLFQRVSGIVTSQTVVAHLRKATIGEPTIINTHPFQHGYWVFAHNGNLKNFSEHREALLAKIEPSLRKHILGQTDSELIFHLLLSAIARRTDLYARNQRVGSIAAAVRETVEILVETVGPTCDVDNGPADDTYLTFLLSDGRLMVGYQAGKSLFYSTHKKRCPERGECPFFAPQCEAQRTSGQVNHLIFSSEPLHGENVWNPVGNHRVIGLDGAMHLHIEG